MITFERDSRELVKIVTIDRIAPIPDADLIERAIIGGWEVITRKGEFSEGDAALYFEIDSCLPVDDERFAFLEPRGCKTQDQVRYHKLRTMKLRGFYSQGLALPTTSFATEIARSEEKGSSLAEELGVGKWEVELPVGTNVVGDFPSHLRKSDSERAQNLTKMWPRLAEVEWVATEKLDGTSQTLYRDEDGVVLCSRNWKISINPDTAGGQVAAEFAEKLPVGYVIQYELVGPGIQGNPLKLTKAKGMIFTYALGRNPLPRSEWPDWALEASVPVLPSESVQNLTSALRDGVEALLGAVDGMRSVVNPQVLAEGIVFHTASGEDVQGLGRNTFKVISNKYLAKEKD